MGAGGESVLSAALPLLLDVALKGAALVALAGIVAAALRRSSASMRHMIWSLAMAGLLALPILSALLPQWRILPAAFAVIPGAAQPAGVSRPSASGVGPVAVPAVHDAGDIAPAYRTDAAQPPPDMSVAGVAQPSDAVRREPPAVSVGAFPRHFWRPWSVAVWASIALLLLIPLLVGRIALWRLARAARRGADADWQAALAESSRQLRLRRPVELLISPRPVMPMAWGVLRGRILLPSDAMAWTAERRRAVLLHELAHVQRRDCLAHLVANLACALHWFNPLVWVARRRMVIERERACDDLVLGVGIRPSDYAEHLVQVVSHRPGGRLVSSAAIAMARPSRLEGRVRALLDERLNRRAVTRAMVLTGLILAAGVAIPLAALRAQGDDGKSVTARAALLESKDAGPGNPPADAPQLRFLAWLDDYPGFTKGHAWYPDGRIVESPEDIALIRSLPPINMELKDGHPPYLLQWWSQPGLFADIFKAGGSEFLGAIPIPVPVPGGPVGSNLHRPSAANGNVGWVVQSSPMKTGLLAARSISFRVHYSVGEWKLLITVPPDCTDGVPLLSGDSMGTVKRLTNAREAFGVDNGVIPPGGWTQLHYARHRTDIPPNEYRFVAETRGGERLLGELNYSGMFKVSPDEIVAIHAYSRPVSKIVCRNVSLAAGKATRFEVESESARETPPQPPSRGSDAEKIAKAKVDVQAISIAVEAFRADMGRYPTSEEGLSALWMSSAQKQNWNGPYIKQSPPIADAWGFYYVYRHRGPHNPQSFDLFSFGPDGQEGGGDDIGNWTQNAQVATASVGVAPDAPLLQFRLVDESGKADASLTDPSSGKALALRPEILLTEAHVRSAAPTQGEDGIWAVRLTLTPEGSERFSKITGENLGRQLAIVFDAKVLCAPVIRSRISGSALLTLGGAEAKTKAAEIAETLNGKAGKVETPAPAVPSVAKSTDSSAQPNPTAVAITRMIQPELEVTPFYVRLQAPDGTLLVAALRGREFRMAKSVDDLAKAQPFIHPCVLFPQGRLATNEEVAAFNRAMTRGRDQVAKVSASPVQQMMGFASHLTKECLVQDGMGQLLGVRMSFSYLWQTMDQDRYWSYSEYAGNDGVVATVDPDKAPLLVYPPTPDLSFRLTVMPDRGIIADVMDGHKRVDVWRFPKREGGVFDGGFVRPKITLLDKDGRPASEPAESVSKPSPDETVTYKVSADLGPFGPGILTERLTSKGEGRTQLPAPRRP